MTEVVLNGLATGWCTAVERLLTRAGRLRRVRVWAVVALVEHPALGLVAVDTGYAPRVLGASRRWPYRLYRLATPMTAPPALSLATHVAARGEPVAAVVLTHLHADHTAGLADFPDARVLAPRRAWPERRLRGLAAVRRAILPDLLPPELDARAELVEPCEGAVDCGALGRGLDLFGDGSLVAVDLPGHARGQLGVLVRDRWLGPALVAADALWDTRALRPGGEASRWTRGVAHDARAQAETLERVRAWQRQSGGAVLPAHDLAAWRAWGDRHRALARGDADPGLAARFRA